ncbi:MAG: DUF3108 domain-containing protein [Bacteroidia bacterium]
MLPHLFVWLAATLLAGAPASHAGSDARYDAFGKGEYVQYRIHYGLITAGYASTEVMPHTAYEQGRPCHHIVGLGWTHPGFDWFYKVRDRYETYIDEQSLLALRFNRHIAEGGFESYTETYFDQTRHQARYIDEHKRETRYDVPPGIQDVISAFFYARSAYDGSSLAIGDRISLRNFLDRKTFNLEARLRSREIVKVGDKSFDALCFDLLIDDAGMITDGSTIRFWISDDANKVLLRVESELTIGSLKADIMTWQNLRHPFSALR